MKRLFLRYTENMTPQARSAFLFTSILTIAHLIAAPYYLYLSNATEVPQFLTLALVSFGLAILLSTGTLLSWRGKATEGTILALLSLGLVYPPLSLIVSRLGLILGPALMIVGAMIAPQVLSRKLGQWMAGFTTVTGLAALLLDVFGSTTRPSLPGLVIPLLAFSAIGVLAFLVLGEFRRIRTSVSYKLILTVVSILAVIAGVQIVFSSWTTAQRFEEEAHEMIASHYQTYETRIKTQQLSAEALALGLANRRDVQEAYLSGDRERLFNLLAPMFEEWKDREIVHLYIQNPDGTVFLRVHNPEKFGDDITYRGTANTALTEKRVTSGVEIGPSRLGVRGVAPMYSTDGQFIGLAEVGVDFDEQFVKDLKEITGADFTMWVLHEAAAIPNLKPAQGAPAAPIQEVFYYASTTSDMPLMDPSVYRSVLSTKEPAFQIIRNAPVPSIVYVIPLLGYQGKLIGLLQISESYAGQLEAQQTSVRTTLGVTTSLTILGLFLIALFSTRLIIQPLNLLSEFATKQMKGETKVRVSVTSRDEFQQLAETFNLLAGSVEEERANLEQRVAERTHSLELAAEVGRSVSQVQALDIMLSDAAELIRSQFSLYYVQVYLVNASRTYLNLQAGTGHVGKQLLERNHRLPFNPDSINGRAAVEKTPVVIADTASSVSFKPNALLPDTRSEMAVPLLIGERVVGVLDMQSEIPGSLNEEQLTAFEALAGQLAIAIQNANFLAETEQARAEVEAQAKRLTRANWADYLDAIHKPEEAGFVFQQNKVMPLTQELETKADALVAPINVTGEPVGNLVVELEGQSPIARTEELLNTVARQVAQQIENLRLLESAERYRLEAEEASRRLTREGWKDYVDNAAENLSFVYDLRKVRPANSEGDDPSETTGYVLPIRVREENIGKLLIQGLESDDTESIELVNAVAERLAVHIESLRQFDETQRGQIELDKRARQLAAVAEVSSVSSRELNIQKMLESVVHLTQRKFALYHAHVFLYNEHTDILKIAACGWKEGDPHEGTHGTAAIPLTQEISLVARSGRTRTPVIVNDVRNEPGWLPNPLLPDTHAELAVPLAIGDKLLGVLDVQSDMVNAFSEEDGNIFATLASQISTALQNAYSFAQAQQQAERESKLNMISQKIQSATSVEAVLQIAARELGHALGAPLTIAQLGLKDRGNGAKQLQPEMER